MATDGLRGKRVLILEDESLFALCLEQLLEPLGCVVIGPAHTPGKGLALTRRAGFEPSLEALAEAHGHRTPSP